MPFDAVITEDALEPLVHVSFRFPECEQATAAGTPVPGEEMDEGSVKV
jgi:hypothetical protein